MFGQLAPLCLCVVMFTVFSEDTAEGTSVTVCDSDAGFDKPAKC